ncbi:MAG: TonB-dependent receptor [Chitinophagaceae bacterium]|nr:TonB-dependent receptor [Chitinophagaceae bacterium]
MNNRLRTCLLFFLVMIIGSANAQSTRTNISGTVKDSIKGVLAYATVGLYRSAQMQEALRTTYTNEKGVFKFRDIDTGKYTLVVSHTGYTDKQVGLVLTGAANTDAGTIELAATATDLTGVTVTARKPLIEQKDDKIIFNVENDPATKTETAIDILRKTPFVSVDGESNITVNGQSNFKVLLNGKETAMFAQNVKEALKGFPGALITKIEVITSPGAKYDGEGIGGIINIITKKKLKGYNGSISTYASSNRFANVNANLSVKVGKLGATAYYGAGRNFNQPGSSRTETIPLVPSVFTRRVLEGNRTNNNFWNFGNAEASFEIDSLNTISAYGNVSGGWNESMLGQIIFTEFPSAHASSSYYQLRNRNEYPTTSIGTDFIRKYKSNPEKEFTIRLNGELGDNNQFSNSFQDNSGTDRYILNRSVAKNRQYTFQSDYIQPFKNNIKLESGVKAILRRATSDFNSQIKYDAATDFKVNPANTDYFSYNQDVYSAYTTYSFKVKNTTLRLGLRAEHTVVDGDFVSTATNVNQEYTALLPNLQASLKLSNSTSMVFTYGKRLQRPYIWNLNPFVNNNDSLYISYGNPGLDPQTIHSVSAQARINKNGSFASLTLTGSYSDDMIVQYASFNQATGVTATTSANLGEELQLNLNANMNVKVNQKWNIFLHGNVRFNHVKNKTLSSQSNSGVGGNANLNTNYSINKRFNISAYAGFWRSPVTIQFRYPLNHWYGLNFGYKMFNEKLNVSVGASNFLRENWDYRMILNDPNFRTETTSTFLFRGLALSMTWNFGKLTENVSKKKGVTNDDLIGGGN